MSGRGELSGGVPFRPGVSLVVRLSDHQIDRYRERVRPSLAPHQAASECLHNLEIATLSTSAPDWLGPTTQRPAFYICLGDIAMPADPDWLNPDQLVVRTVLSARERPVAARRAARRRRRMLRAAERREARDRRAERDRRRARRPRNDRSQGGRR